MIPLANISPNTPMRANLVAGGGAMFRTWAPLANVVYINRTFGGFSLTGQTDNLLLAKDANGHWTGVVASAKEGGPYRFWVAGPGGSGYKRDPYSRELAPAAAFPNCNSPIRSASSYPWHDSAFVTCDFSKPIIYQLHVGTYKPSKPSVASTFLDVIGKIPYIMALGVNVLQSLPIDEMENGDPSMGYNGADLFSPDFLFVVTDPAALTRYLGTINGLLAKRRSSPLCVQHINPGLAQLKALVVAR